ncbi:HD-GYP domain-containing protein [Glaciecola sp. SC05]|uniref:HD-GYP domain-containing protein n=1 Tax=Glaciecola sp. SC05 TaxID=1987355 RepID=UPI003528B066
MTASLLKTLSVQDLKLGMIVHSIAQQSGRLMVKSKGKIRHKGVIDQLIACGVSTVVVEMPKPLPSSNRAFKLPSKTKPVLPAIAPELPEIDDFIGLQAANDDSIVGSTVVSLDTIHIEETTDDFPPVALDKAVSSSKQLEAAEQLVIDCKNLHQRLRIDIENEVKIDLSAAKSLVSEMHHGLMHNPDALLCLSMIRNEGEYLSNHAMHVAILLCHFARYLGMSETDCKRLALLGYFFDIGMVRVPKEILNSQEKPSVEEQMIIQAHVKYSIDILEPLNIDNELLLAIEQHHERLDGNGYPNQLQGEDIHKFSRMLAIVDCYDAMTTNRPFQKKTSPASALKLIANKDYGYDLKLALQFIRCMGVYPVGSLVILNNKHIAIVTKVKQNDALKPKVKMFYSISHGEYVEPKTIDLSVKGCKFQIVKPTLPEHYRLDMDRVPI